ncbi:MAG: hypothetical protein V2A79_14195 [Planctomycetota bacterium]
MYRDPVVEEVRRHGAEIAEQCDGDIRRMAERFRREQAEGARVIVRRQIRPTERPGREPER